MARTIMEIGPGGVPLPDDARATGREWSAHYRCPGEVRASFGAAIDYTTTKAEFLQQAAAAGDPITVVPHTP
jgi:hypothetical protein